MVSQGTSPVPLPPTLPLPLSHGHPLSTRLYPITPISWSSVCQEIAVRFPSSTTTIAAPLTRPTLYGHCTRSWCCCSCCQRSLAVLMDSSHPLIFGTKLAAGYGDGGGVFAVHWAGACNPSTKQPDGIITGHIRDDVRHVAATWGGDIENWLWIDSRVLSWSHSQSIGEAGAVPRKCSNIPRSEDIVRMQEAQSTAWHLLVSFYRHHNHQP